MSFAYFDWISHHAEARGHRTAAIDLSTGRRFTYREWDERIDRLAAHLSSLGVKKDERVVVLAANSTDFLETQFACFPPRRDLHPVNIRLTVHELAFIVSRFEPVVSRPRHRLCGHGERSAKAVRRAASARIQSGLRGDDRRFEAPRAPRGGLDG